MQPFTIHGATIILPAAKRRKKIAPRPASLRTVFDDGHLAKNFSGDKLRKNAAAITTDQPGDFHQSVFDKINTVTGRAFLENLTANCELLLLRDQLQRLQFFLIEIAEQGDGFIVRP